jgi:serine protease Do
MQKPRKLSAGWALALAVIVGAGMARAETAAPAAGAGAAASLSSTAERLFAAARPKLLQIRTLLTATGRQSSLGSGFLVGEDGLAITNYHVVSQSALEPGTYRLEYVAVDGGRGEVKLLAIDLPNDLALVRIDKSGGPYFTLDDAAAGGLAKGERLYSMGNPLDLGFTIVEGTYNGLVERSYNERIHFTGAINPGMSGGPAVTAEGRVAGINVARQVGGELVSFLVPARFAQALLERARGAEPLQPKGFRAEIGLQLAQWQARLYESFAERGFRPVGFGPYQAPESAAPWFTCWAQTNAGQVPKPRASVDTTNCNSDTRLFIASDLNTGLIHLAHSYVRAVDLNQFQFAAFLSQQSRPSAIGGFARKWLTQQRCHEDFVIAAPQGEHPALRAVWCARAYRDFAGLYDVSVTAITEDRGSEALVSRLSLQAVGYDDAVKLTRRFLEDLQWTR